MSFDEIRSAAATRALAVLSTHKELKNIFNIEDNPIGDLKQGVCASWGEGIPTTGPTCKVAMNGTLLISITREINVRSLDDQAPSVAPIYQDADKIVKSFFDATLLGIPTKIRGIKDVSFSRPKLLKGSEYAMLELSFTVDFTMKINT